MASGETVRKGGKRGPAVVPWKSQESLLFQAVTRKGELKMPPTGALQDTDIEIVRKWIDAGAVWPNKKASLHWAYRPITKSDSTDGSGIDNAAIRRYGDRCPRARIDIDGGVNC